MAMRLKSLTALLTILFGLLSLPSLRAASRSAEPRPDLVVVLNTNPSNPLGGEIWLMDLSGRLVRRVTRNNSHEERPQFSPDGNRIVFVRNMGGIAPGAGLDPRHNEIFVYDLRTGAESRLTRNDVEDGRPEWSFDGKSIAFFSRRNHPEGKATLWVMQADGSRPRQITTLQPGDISHVDPNWGPDGQWLAFANYRVENGRRFSRIEKIRLDGSQRTVISSGGKYLKAGGAEKEEPLGDVDPSHSPDGAMIWSARRLDNSRTHLFAFGAGTYYGGKAEIDMDWPVHPGAIERGPRCSPDGRRILLTRSSPKAGTRTRQLVLMDLQSSFRRYLTSREDWDAWHPSWHPFAGSGVDRENGGALVSYSAPNPVGFRTFLAQDGANHSADRRPEGPDGVRLTVSARGAEVKGAAPAAYEIKWKLGEPRERVSFLTLRLQAKLRAEEAGGGKSLQFQLREWEEKKWVTVFVLPKITDASVQIRHEIAPAGFISRDGQEVWLRLIASGAWSASPAPESNAITLDVKKY